MRRKLSLVILGLLLGFSSLEVLLRVYLTILGHPGIDARGFRNASALERTDIVAIGDSQTWGYNVAPEAAWPQQLGHMLHRRVYQIAQGGWGPGEYYRHLEEAIALKPKVIIIGYYLGNDLADAFAIVYRTADYKDHSPDPLLAPFMSADPKVRESVQRAEMNDPAWLRLTYMWCNPSGRRTMANPHLQQMHETLTGPPLAPLAVPAHRMSLRTTIGSLLGISLVYQSTRGAFFQARDRIAARTTDYGPYAHVCVRFRDHQLETVFTVGQRFVLLDRADPRVVEGERISLSIFQTMAERSRRAGIRFYVALIPTKEIAFRARAEASLRNEIYLRELWNAEAIARSNALTFFNREGINAIDRLGLETMIASGTNPYLETEESHPIAPGYEAIARAVATRLQHDGFGESP